MTTFDQLQRLSDDQFHKLCDDLFCRLDRRYCRLETYGLNADGDSIKGQPDSYVGETPSTCTIAFQYSVEKKGWWRKIKKEVREAVRASPRVQEIVVATPCDKNRSGPRDKTVDWLSEAKAEAGNRTLQVYDGRKITRYLDNDRQDLRSKYLHIPYSQLSSDSIVASCEIANSQAIAELESSGRYDPARYSPRRADSRLFELWQHAVRSTCDERSSDGHAVRLIALVNDSGVGKSSLLATFVRSFGSTLPALLLQARNLAFASEDSLVIHVVQALYGVLDHSTRNMEESALVHHLTGGFPLTVVLDGLDEAKDSDLVRKAINGWLNSKLGKVSVLIASSRLEFWKACVDRGWHRWMSKNDLDDRKPTVVTRVERSDPTDGIQIPDRFTAEELEAAWMRAAQPRDQLYILPKETQEELRHPFTLRVYLDLLTDGGLPRQATRTTS